MLKLSLFMVSKIKNLQNPKIKRKTIAQFIPFRLLKYQYKVSFSSGVLTIKKMLIIYTSDSENLSIFLKLLNRTEVVM